MAKLDRRLSVFDFFSRTRHSPRLPGSSKEFVTKGLSLNFNFLNARGRVYTERSQRLAEVPSPSGLPENQNECSPERGEHA
jgi:hypothetical protein